MPAGCYWVLNKGPRRGLYPEYNGRGEALHPKPQTSHLGRCMNLPHIFIISLRFLVEEINKKETNRQTSVGNPREPIQAVCIYLNNGLSSYQITHSTDLSQY